MRLGWPRLGSAATTAWRGFLVVARAGAGAPLPDPRPAQLRARDLRWINRYDGTGSIRPRRHPSWGCRAAAKATAGAAPAGPDWRSAVVAALAVRRGLITPVAANSPFLIGVDAVVTLFADAAGGNVGHGGFLSLPSRSSTSGCEPRPVSRCGRSGRLSSSGRGC